MFQKNLPWLAFAIVVLSGLLIGFFQWNQASNGPITINNIAVPPLPMLDENAIAQGEILYQQYCAACHKPDLSGAPHWKKTLPDGSLPPPPHDDSGHTWHHPDFLILQIIAEGGAVYEGVMPGFGEHLTPDDMEAILEFLKSHWSRKSREYQWWLTNTYPTPSP